MQYQQINHSPSNSSTSIIDPISASLQVPQNVVPGLGDANEGIQVPVLKYKRALKACIPCRNAKVFFPPLPFVLCPCPYAL